MTDHPSALGAGADKKVATAEPAGSAPASQFYIPATMSLLERRPRTLKHGDTFAMFDHYGDIVDAVSSPDGLFHRDTRHLSELELALDRHRFLLLSSTLQDDNAVLTVDLANPDIYRDGRIVLLRETLHLIRTKFLWSGRCHERLALHNFDRRPHRISLGIRFAADFADLFEVRGIRRKRRGVSRVDRPKADSVLLRYEGLDAVERSTRIDFAPTPTWLGEREAIFDLTLAPGERRSFFVTVRCEPGPPARRGDFFFSMRQAQRALRASTANNAIVDSSNTSLNRVLCRSVADLYMLITDKPEGPYPYAGIPWFSTAFGRDGIITAMEMLWFDPAVAKGVLKFLAATQAKSVDRAADAEPGKILHETRQGEMAKLGEVPFGLYYGSVDATPLFVQLAGLYFERTGDLETVKALWPHIEAALGWIDSYGDPDRDGFVEYRTGGKGLSNQGWKDSADAISHEDGRLARGAVALCEVQAYVYAAKRHAAAICRALGHSATAARLEDQAEQLREHFEAAFWCEDLGTYALALDGAKQPCRVVSSNAGHALFAGIARPERAKRVAASLLGRECFSGWGVRTLSSAASRYNPMSYHNGSVWPHDNAILALGLARYGLKREVLRVFEGQFEAIQYMDLLRPPELFCGFNRRRGKAPTLYPVACVPQAWASAAPLAFLEACLGLQCDYAKREIRFERPQLPSFVDEVRLRRLSLGDARVDVLLRRYENGVAVNVIERRGDVRVVVVS
jgi:glycogen debranching enzyme